MGVMKYSTIPSRPSYMPKYVPRAGDGCVLWLPGQDDPQSTTIRDRSGKGNNGAITSATWTRSPSGLWVLDFNGTSDFITVSDADSLSQVAGFTLSVWVNMDDATTFPIMSKGTLTGDREFRWGLEADAMYFYVIDAGIDPATFIGRSTAALTSSEGSWVHFAATYDGGITSASCKLYRNGVQIDTGDNENNVASFVAMENQTANMRIGNYTTSYANGKMALPKLRSVVLTVAQLLAEYNQERHLFGV